MSAGDSTRPQDSPSAPAGAVEDEATGLPGLHTWDRVYWFVFGSFVAWVLLLALLARAFP